jgi:IPT/TIG domain-containing protein
MSKVSTNGFVLLAALLFANVPSVARVHARQEALRASFPRTAAPARRIGDAQLGAGGTWLVYAAGRENDGTLELHSVPVEGGIPVDLGGPLSTSCARPWSLEPDGKHVVYVGQDLFRVPVDGHARRERLGDACITGLARDFVLGPPGAPVVYRAGTPGLFSGLYAVASEGKRPPLELVSPDGPDVVSGDYRLSPDGRTVVFLAWQEGGAGMRLCSVPSADGTITVLASASEGIADFEISADSRQVLYRANDPARDAHTLFRVPIDGGELPVVLAPPHAAGADVREFELACDGARVVFLASVEGVSQALFVAPTDGSAPPFELDAADGDASVSAFRIDPRGRWVAYRRERGERSELRLVPIDGGAAADVGARPSEGERVGWFDFTPDGELLLHQVRSDERGPELRRVSLPSSAVAVRASTPLVAQELELGPDCRSVVYRDPESGLWSLALAASALPTLLAPATLPGAFRISADGRHVLYSALVEDGAHLAPGLFRVPIDGGSAPLRIDQARVPSTGASSSFGARPSGGRVASVGDVGFRDFSYGITGNSTPTGEKPESKLWWNDGVWWASLYDDAAQDYHIYGLNPANQSWVNTGTALDGRSSTKADVLWDQASGKLYVASHVFSGSAGPTSASNSGRLFRYAYASAGKSYTLEPGFPVDITHATAEALTLAKDSHGRLWATWVESSRVMINHSTTGDAQWSEPFALPASPASTAVSTDDISAIVAFGTSVGVMWSNQLTSTTYFAVHRDADGPAVWQAEEVVVPGAQCSGACSDDLFNLKADASGRVLVALKTSLTASDDPLDLVAVRSPAGLWQTSVFGRVRDHHTRPILLLDEPNGQVYVFATTPESGGAIHYKSAPLADLRFEEGLGTPFIRTATDLSINNATSTKQNLDGQTDLVVMASDQDTRFYLHNVLDLESAGGAPTIGSFEPLGGASGTQVTVLGSHFEGTTRVDFNGAQAAFTLVSGGEIRTAVPAGATTGRIHVTTPEGTGTSASDFVVTQAPTIGSFSPASGPVGTDVTIDGNQFTGATRVAFNGVGASFVVVSATRIRAGVPPGAATGRITVTTPAGTGTSAGDFVVTQAPTIGSFSPASGPVGTDVTIDGNHLAGATRVEFNGAAAAFTVSSTTRIATRVPNGATSGRIRVFTAAGVATSSRDFVVLRAPSIGSFSPASGSVGTRVTVNGAEFTGTTRVSFGGATASFTVVSSTRIEATVPAGASTGRIGVTTPGGSATSAADFRVTRPPIVSSFTPSVGLLLTPVTIRGSYFSGATSVTFDGRPSLVFAVLGDGLIEALVPLGACTGRIAVTTGQGTGVSASDFHVIGCP